jgi:ribulose-phosphate 3-epimerase
MRELLPAILAKDEQTFRERVKLMEGVMPVVHLDVMDGEFVPNKTWFDAAVLASLKTPVRFELHLMVADPKRYIEEVRGIASVIRAIWHIESDADHRKIIIACRSMPKQAGLAINPRTPINGLAPYADRLDEVLVMGADPGFSGKPLKPHTIDRCRDIHERWPKMPIGFDIGVKEESIPDLKAVGVTRFCAASAIFSAKDPAAEAKRLQGLV